MIAVRSLAKSYGERQVLADVDLDLPAGGVIGLVGANGAGKSTLLSVMARLLGADAGTVEVGGLNVATAPGRQLATVLSVLKQDNHLAVRLTVRDLVGFGRYPHNRGRPTEHDETIVDQALEWMDLTELADRYLDSSVAYQGAARSLGPQEVRDLSLWATEGLLPDLTVLLDGDPDLAERRTTGRGAKDRLEQEGDAFRVALREQFLTLAQAEPERFVVVDADRPVDQVADDVIEAVVAAVRRHGVHLAHGGAHQGVLLGLEAFVEAAARRSAAGSDQEPRS